MVPLFQSLSVGQLVFAQQTRSGQQSEPSNVGVPVVAVPNPLPTVIFASPVTECMNHVLLAGLVPGADAVVKHGATTLGSTTVDATSAWVAVDANLLDDGIGADGGWSQQRPIHLAAADRHRRSRRSASAEDWPAPGRMRHVAPRVGRCACRRAASRRRR